MKLAALMLLLAGAPAVAQSRAAAPQVYFQPGGGAGAAVVRALSGARQTVRVQAYGFSSNEIASALIAAAERGVSVEVILDSSEAGRNHARALLAAHVPTYIDTAHAIAHNKVIVIDGAIVITGSYNFTIAAENDNAENLLVLTDPTLAAKYASNWQTHREHSTVAAKFTHRLPRVDRAPAAQ